MLLFRAVPQRCLRCRPSPFSPPRAKSIRICSHSSCNLCSSFVYRSSLLSFSLLLSLQTQVRNVAVAGQLHHGKTTLLDLLVQQTHTRNWTSAHNQRYTDTLKMEQVCDVCAMNRLSAIGSMHLCSCMRGFDSSLRTGTLNFYQIYADFFASANNTRQIVCDQFD